MASTAAEAAGSSAASRSKKNKKKKGKGKTQANGESQAPDAAQQDTDHDADDAGEAEDAEHTVDSEHTTVEMNTPAAAAENGITTPAVDIDAIIDGGENGTGPLLSRLADGGEDADGTEHRLDAAVRERDQLRAEVTELRRSLESLQGQRPDEVPSSSVELAEMRAAKEHAENRYHKLLGQVNTIKTQLGERLKSDAAELAATRKQVEDLETGKRAVQTENDSLRSQVSSMTSEKDKLDKEVSELRGRTTLSQQNWAKERDELLMRQAQITEEFENAKRAMDDWEVLATEERAQADGLRDRVTELEETLSSQRESHERLVSERDDQSVTVDGLQRALQDIQEARRKELREIVESSETQIEALRSQLRAVEETSTTSQAELEKTRQELERALPFEKEVREKNLLIGKLRHEAVILNDHLTKALRFLKRGKPEDNVDRALVTNHLLPFLQLDRSDPKKFQILQLISALLGWTEEQKETAGLTRPGANASSTTLKVPLGSSFRRVSSTASMTTSPSNPLASPTSPGFDPMTTPTGKESLAELWSDFLEREAQQGIDRSRRGSLVAGVKSPPTTPSISSAAGRLRGVMEGDDDAASESSRVGSRG